MGNPFAYVGATRHADKRGFGVAAPEHERRVFFSEKGLVAINACEGKVERRHRTELKPDIFHRRLVYGGDERETWHTTDDTLLRRVGLSQHRLGSAGLVPEERLLEQTRRLQDVCERRQLAEHRRLTRDALDLG